MQFILRFIFLVSFSSTQTIQFLVDKNIVEKDEAITFSIETIGSNDFPKVDVSSIEKYFNIISGPSQQTNIQWVNGNMTNTKKLTWTILPINIGEVFIPPISGTLDGKKFEGKSIKIIVKNKNIKVDDSIFIKAEIDKKEVYIGEQITLTYNLYKNVNASIEPFQMPEFPGFWIEDIFTPKRLSYQNKTIKGVRYQVAKLGQKALFPMLSDKHSIPSLKIKANIELKKKRRNRDPFFDPFFDSFFTESKTKFLSSEVIDIKIKNLPTPIPDNFNGAIGNFSLSCNLDIDTIKVNEGFTYTIKLKGSGNLGLFSLSKLKFPVEIEAFPPVDKFEKDIFRNQLTGSQIWEYMLIPRKSGQIKLPSVEMSYFDPKVEEWFFTKTEPIFIDVMKGNSINEDYFGLKKTEIEMLDKDIRFISDDIGKVIENNRKENKKLIYIYLLSFFILLAPKIIGKIRGYKLSNPGIRKSQKALRSGLKILKNKNLDPYETASNAFYIFLSDKLNLNTIQLDPSQIEKKLKNNIPDSLLDKTLELLRLCDINKYGLANRKSENNIIDNMGSLIKEIDKQIK